MESSAQEIHENLNAVIDYQTHHRLRETQGRHRAEDLNERIMIWSVFVTVAIFMVGFGQVRFLIQTLVKTYLLPFLNNFVLKLRYNFYFQVFVLKSFFSEKRPSQMYGAHWYFLLVIKPCDFDISWAAVTYSAIKPSTLVIKSWCFHRIDPILWPAIRSDSCVNDITNLLLFMYLSILIHKQPPFFVNFI